MQSQLFTFLDPHPTELGHAQIFNKLVQEITSKIELTSVLSNYTNDDFIELYLPNGKWNLLKSRVS